MFGVYAYHSLSLACTASADGFPFSERLVPVARLQLMLRCVSDDREAAENQQFMSDRSTMAWALHMELGNL